MEPDIAKIIQLRKAKKLTQNMVAAHLGIGRNTYIHREKYGEFSDKDLAALTELLESTETVIRSEKKINNHFIMNRQNDLLMKIERRDQIIIERDQAIARLEGRIAKLETLLELSLEIIKQQNK